jgi:predicted patatin/cPLA2 family phospholipase
MRVVATSGHMIDAPRRAEPRFPPEAEPRVTAAVAAALDVGPDDVVITQGARGSDLIVAEHALNRGARVQMLLAQEPGAFRAASVGTAWAARFDAVVARAERVAVLPDQPAGGSPYAAANAWVLDESARLAGAASPEAFVVWDREEGDGAGGTAHFARLAREAGLALTAVVPREAWRTPNRPYWERQWAPGPKRLLALDGGGIRGLITLEVLRRIEHELGGGSETFVLSDHFDYIAGTSTGAIIATSLALGRRVDEITQMYVQMSRRVFRRRFFPRRLKSFYKEHGLSEQLRDYFGAETTLGDDNLRSLLLIVLHRTDTDSLWALSNNSWAKYNARDGADCNLAFELWRVVRGSAAAPVYFVPEAIEVGGQPVLFQDGGITPFNSPALLLFQAATARQYRLGWSTGAERLQLVSVGTGFAAATHEHLASRQVNLLFNARNVLRVIMNGSAVENDRLCRVLGDCRFGPAIDSEFDDPVPDAPAQPLFTYVRYNADLSERGLAALGVPQFDAKRVSKLDAVDAIPELREIGRRLAQEVQPSHLSGFDVVS